MIHGFLKRVETKEARVGIYGLGYVGLPLSLSFCAKGFAVIGFDIDPEKIERLNRGETYIQHIGAGGGAGGWVAAVVFVWEAGIKRDEWLGE